MKSTLLNPDKWVVSIPVIETERFKIPNGFVDSERTPEEINKIKESALKYVATERIKTLAQPKIRIESKSEESTSTPSKVKLSALNYMPSKRILQLARPRSSVHERTILKIKN